MREEANGSLVLVIYLAVTTLRISDLSVESSEFSS